MRGVMLLNISLPVVCVPHTANHRFRVRMLIGHFAHVARADRFWPAMRTLAMTEGGTD